MAHHRHSGLPVSFKPRSPKLPPPLPAARILFLFPSPLKKKKTNKFFAPSLLKSHSPILLPTPSLFSFTKCLLRARSFPGLFLVPEEGAGGFAAHPFL